MLVWPFPPTRPTGVSSDVQGEHYVRSSLDITRLTPDHVDHHPVWSGVRGHAGVVTARAGGRVGYGKPALDTETKLA